jgi:tRNA pseudouridine38-40 synthase
MKNLFLRLSFYGEKFYGTQKQPHDETIQGLFEKLLSQIYTKPVKVVIASRLDRGVHALDFALCFQTPDDSISIEHLFYYLKRSVPKDIYLKDLRQVRDDFSPRYDCRNKQYLYLIQNSASINPLLSPFTFIPKHPLDENSLSSVLDIINGEHDFRYFSTPEEDDNTIINIEDAYMVKNGDILAIRFVSKSFLRYQVRFMVGAMIYHAYGKLSLDEIKIALDGKKPTHFKYKAEPQGLILEKINYPEVEDKDVVTFPFLDRE